MKVIHPLDPVYDENSKVLVLGSIPSVKSREEGFYYMHPKNRFWKTLEKVYGEKLEDGIEGKKKFLHEHHIALFDVVKSCDIESSSDSSIKNIVPNDFSIIIDSSKIDIVFTTGKKAFQLYEKYCKDITGIEAIYLPSTSPANCRKGIDEILVKEYMKIREVTDR